MDGAEVRTELNDVLANAGFDPVKKREVPEPADRFLMPGAK